MLEQLEGLVRLIDEGIAAAGNTRSMDYQQFRRASEAIIDSLIEEGAVVDTGAGYSLELAGIKCASRVGYFGLIQNWKDAARRKISRLRADERRRA